MRALSAVSIAAIACACTAACGRLHFEDVTAREMDAADLQVGPCRVTPMVPDPLSITGVTVGAPTFDTTAPEPGVTTRAIDARGTMLAGTVSDATGSYALSVPTAHRPPVVGLEVTKPGFITTIHLPEQLTRDVRDNTAYLLTPAQHENIYVTANVVRDPTKATVILLAADCQDAALGGVAFSVTPAPGAIAYADAGSAPSTTQATTLAAYPFAWALNVPPGSIEVSATLAGRSFLVETHTVTPEIRYVAFVRPVEP